MPNWPRLAGIELLDFEVHEQTNFALLATVGIDPRTRWLFLSVTGDAQGITATRAHEYADTFIGALAAIAHSPEQAALDFTSRSRRHATDDRRARPPDALRRCSRPRGLAVGGHGESAQTIAAPRTPAEAALADVFASVLGVESVGVHDNFFTIGGDSILALVVRSKAEKRGITFDIEELYARPTIAELAESSSRPAPKPQASPSPSRCFR